jgi:hypothetical protein
MIRRPTTESTDDGTSTTEILLEIHVPYRAERSLCCFMSLVVVKCRKGSKAAEKVPPFGERYRNIPTAWR